MRAPIIKSTHHHLTSFTAILNKMSYKCSSHASRLLRPIQLVLDFDGTLTRKDTMHIVANVGYKSRRQGSEAVSYDSKQLLPWNKVVQAYMDDFSAHTRAYKPPKESRQTTDEELEWLNSLKPVEVASAERVNEAGIFDTVTAHDMKNGAREALDSGQVELRHGWWRLLAAIYNANQPWYGQAGSTDLSAVISVNWSQSFVKNVLLIGARAADVSDEQSQGISAVESMTVYANEIPSIRNVTNDNLPTIDTRTSGDKLQQLLRLKRSASRLSETPLCVYVGDSTTDLGCLLAAELGVCIRDEPMSSGQKELAETCQRLDVPVDPIKDLNAEELSAEVILQYGSLKRTLPTSKRLWYGTSFEEIYSALEKLLHTD